MKGLQVIMAMGAVAMLGAGAMMLMARGESGVEVVSPAHGPAVQAVFATGTVEGTVMMPIESRLQGHITELLVKEGDAVAKGQPLAQLENDELKRTVDELTAKVDLARKDNARKAGLAKTGAGAVEAAERAKADLDMAEAALARAQVNVDYMRLVAPEAGTIIKHDGEVGELIAAQAPVFWLSCCGMRIETEVDEEDIALVKPGQKAAVRADAFPGEVFEGAVQSVTPKGDPVARSYRVRVGLPADTKLMIGMTAETNIVIREKQDALLVPASAVSNGAVWVVEGGKAAKRPVKTGARSATSVEITGGIDDALPVIVDGAQALEDGKSVATKTGRWTP